jgi:hypothetical protein
MQLRTYRRLRELDTRLVGRSSADLARFVQVLRRRGTLKHDEFCQALKSGKVHADGRVERS